MSDATEEYVVAEAADLAEGEHLLAEVGDSEVGVFNVAGDYHAYANWCPHHGAPVCEGAIDGTTEAEFDRDTLDMDLDWVKEEQVLRCPWHAWEFDVLTGETLHADPSRLVEYDVRVEDGDVIVRI
jgi:nitrite reductase/ring-hydroxylating ferredoxin subunit